VSLLSSFHTLGGPGLRCWDLSRSLSETVLRLFFPLPSTVCCHCHLDILDPEDEVTLKYFSTSVLCHGCRGYPDLEEKFSFHFFSSKKKRKKKQEGVRQRDRKVIGSSETSDRSQNRRTAILKDMIATDNGNCMQSHVDVVHNRLNPDDLQVDSLLRATM
jgi:hypothetical protein